MRSGSPMIVPLAVWHPIPAIHQGREHFAAGDSNGYGPSLMDASRQAGISTVRILRGTKPADLPALQPTKFELVINLKAANVLKLTIPQQILQLRNEVSR